MLSRTVRSFVPFVPLAALAAMLLAPASAAADYKSEVLARLGALESKVVGLAETMPQDAMTYRPMEGVRSVSEEFLHVASAGFRAAQLFGGELPEGFNRRGYEASTTDKAKIVADVKQAFANFKKAVEGLGAGDADKTLTLFRREMSQRAALWSSLEHLSEHLGKSISHARANKVVPPWTAARG